MRTIVGERLTLEPQTTAHADQMFIVLSDPAIYEYENAPPRSLEWLRERFAKLESRRSADESEQWLNWVIRLPTLELAGYVQATIYANGRAAIAYELASAYWGQSLARQAVQVMMAELGEQYGVHTLTAVFKRENARSRRLLERLGFALASAEAQTERNVEADELMMQRSLHT
jgi:RimJ/RimL family protein N-acetyltransferase